MPPLFWIVGFGLYLVANRSKKKRKSKALLPAFTDEKKNGITAMEVSFPDDDSEKDHYLDTLLDDFSSQYDDEEEELETPESQALQEANRVMEDGGLPIVAVASSLDTYVEEGGDNPDVIKKHQDILGVPDSGVFDKQTSDVVDLLLLASGEALAKEEAKETPSSPSSRAKLPTRDDLENPVLTSVEPKSGKLTAKERETHRKARNLAIKAYQLATSEGKTHEEGAAIWLKVYWKNGGRWPERIQMMQREMGMPESQWSGTMDRATINFMKDLGAM